MNVAIAFGAGILSFLSPCVLPLVPAFLVNMAGEAALAGTQRTRTVAHALAFVIGFRPRGIHPWPLGRYRPRVDLALCDLRTTDQRKLKSCGSRAN